MSNYFGTWAKYATFKGRATRTEYWVFFIITSILGLVIKEIGFKLGLTTEPNSNNNIRSIPGIIFTLVSITPYIAVSVRRIHDVGLSGWRGWLFIPFAFPMLIVGFIGSLKDNKDDEKYSESDCATPHSTFQINEDEIYEQALDEIENNTMVKATWAKALVESKGDLNKANSLYIKNRSDFLKKDRYATNISKKAKREDPEVNTTNKIKIQNHDLEKRSKEIQIALDIYEKSKS